MVSSKATTVAAYLADLQEDRRKVISDVRDRIASAMPAGYVETMSYGMIGWVVPLDVSGPTYNGQPLGYVNLAAQKRHNALYLTCAYMSEERKARLRGAFADAGLKLDMGKSCIRFKRVADLAWPAIEQEIASTSPEDFLIQADDARNTGRC